MSLDVAVAKTALIIPFLFSEDDDGLRAPAERCASLLARQLVDLKGKTLPFWKRITDRTRQIDELEPAFRSLLSAGARGTGWSIEHLRMPPVTRERFFKRARLATGDGDDFAVWADDFTIESVDLVLFPLDVAALVLRVDWQPKDRLDLDAVAARLDATRHFQQEKIAWSFGQLPVDKPDLPEKAREAMALGAATRRAWFEEVAGPELAAALDGGARTSMEAVARWLVVGSEGAGIRFASARYIRHQTSIALADEPPDKRTVDRALFHTSRAATQRYAAPEDSGPDVVLAPRANRRLALSREGTVSLSWPLKDTDPDEAAANTAFEHKDWSLRFVGGSTLGIYLLLCLLVRAQHLALQRLATRSLATAEKLSDREALKDPKKREGLVDLARLVAQYSLTVASGDCGGVTEYSLFFRGLRQVLGIEHQLRETREGVTGLLELVDTEVERDKSDRDRDKGDRDRRFQGFATELGIIAVAFATVSGVMGANVPNLKMLGIWVLSLFIAWWVGVRLLRWHWDKTDMPQQLDPKTLLELVRPRVTQELRSKLDVVWPNRPFVRSEREPTPFQPPATPPAPKVLSIDDDDELVPRDD